MEESPEEVNFNLEAPTRPMEREGEIIDLSNVEIGNIVAVPLILKTAYIATISTNQPGKVDVDAFLTQADCLHKALGDENDLGREDSGGWKPNKRIDCDT